MMLALAVSKETAELFPFHHGHGVDPGSYLGIKPTPTSAPTTTETSGPTHVVVSAHFKADRLPDPETVKALANMIMFAVKSQRQKSTLTDADT
jgi:hypothetical protein